MMLDRGHFNLRTAVGQSIDKSFAELFANDGYEVVHNEGRFTVEKLHDVQILVTAVAYGGNTDAMAAKSAFTQDEVELVYAWVERGGSLFLLFDHFPVAAAMETLAKRFGVEVELGLASDEAHSVTPPECPVCFSGWIEYTRDNGLLRRHPITEGRNESERVNRVVTFGGSSLTAPKPDDEFLKLSPSASNVPYQSGAPTDQKVRTAQGAALHLGRGRVVMLADTNVVAAQVVKVARNSMALRSGIGYAGANNRQLVLNIVHWLSGLL
ncbi:MAG TPA: hypothetical protein VM120_07160 [Bryobacteraceae bacterium]|nr:hypothetical protein [Bryobacteraceae bacterium]